MAHIGHKIGIPVPGHRASLGTTQGVGGPPALPPGVPASGLVAFFMADQGITLNGGNVSAWADVSGSGNHIAQATPGEQPQFVPNWRNGRPAVLCQDSAREIIRATFVGGAIAQPFSWFVVGSWATTGAGVVAGSGSGARVYIRNFTGNVVSSFAEGANATTTIAMSEGEVFINRTILDGASTLQLIEAPGRPVLEETPGASPGGASMDGYRLFTDGAANDWLNQHIAESLVYNRVLTTQEDLDVRAYLRTKYDVVTA